MTPATEKLVRRKKSSIWAHSGSSRQKAAGGEGPWNYYGRQSMGASKLRIELQADGVGIGIHGAVRGRGGEEGKVKPKGPSLAVL